MIYFVHFIKEQFKSIYYIFLAASGYPDAALDLQNKATWMIYFVHFIKKQFKSIYYIFLAASGYPDAALDLQNKAT